MPILIHIVEVFSIYLHYQAICREYEYDLLSLLTGRKTSFARENKEENQSATELWAR